MERQSLFLLLVTVGLFLITGCGSKVVETVPPVDSSIMNSNMPSLRIAVLPFADYTTGFSPDNALRRQVKLEAAIGHELSRLGIHASINEDVIQCLADIGVIKIIDAGDRGAGDRFLEKELGSGWSDEMRSEIHKILVSARSEEGIGIQTKKIGLDVGTLRAIGQRLGADYVIRGRIIEYEVRDGRTFNPLQKGILPFFFDFSSNLIFGVARSDTYDLWQDTSLGGLLGAAFGASANHPFNAPKKETEIINGGHPRLATALVHESGGFEDHEAYNAAFWGGAAAGAAYLAAKGGRVPEAVVQVALALQDTRTGRVLWSNRVEEEVSPMSVWADSRARTQVDLAVEEAAKSLVADLKNALEALPGEVNTPEPSVATRKPLARFPAPHVGGKDKGSKAETRPSPEEWGS